MNQNKNLNIIDNASSNYVPRENLIQWQQLVVKNDEWDNDVDDVNYGRMNLYDERIDNSPMAEENLLPEDIEEEVEANRIR